MTIIWEDTNLRILGFQDSSKYISDPPKLQIELYRAIGGLHQEKIEKINIRIPLTRWSRIIYSPGDDFFRRICPCAFLELICTLFPDIFCQKHPCEPFHTNSNPPNLLQWDCTPTWDAFGWLTDRAEDEMGLQNDNCILGSQFPPKKEEKVLGGRRRRKAKAEGEHPLLAAPYSY